MTLSLIRILLDFGLFVLIWIIQLVVYPSFGYYSQESLLKWHNKYTRRITYVVLPLMLGQLLISGIQLWNITSFYTVSSFLIVILLWVSTFFQFVPLHNDISKGNFSKKTLENLVKKNWLRTGLWTLLFFISIVEMIR
jgi:DMSO reductase anchor subunit